MLFKKSKGTEYASRKNIITLNIDNNTNIVNTPDQLDGEMHEFLIKLLSFLAKYVKLYI